MTTGALIVFVVSVIACGLFGIYVGFHREDDDHHKNNHHKRT